MLVSLESSSVKKHQISRIIQAFLEQRKARVLLKEIMALPFISPSRAHSAFESCKAELLKHYDDENITKFLGYIKNTFLSGELNSSYPILEWSVYYRLKNNLYLTTNTCEKWNSCASIDFPINSPDLVTVIMYLRTVDVITKEKIGETL